MTGGGGLIAKGVSKHGTLSVLIFRKKQSHCTDSPAQFYGFCKIGQKTENCGILSPPTHWEI